VQIRLSKVRAYSFVAALLCLIPRIHRRFIYLSLPQGFSSLLRIRYPVTHSPGRPVPLRPVARQISRRHRTARCPTHIDSISFVLCTSRRRNEVLDIPCCTVGVVSGSAEACSTRGKSHLGTPRNVAKRILPPGRLICDSSTLAWNHTDSRRTQEQSASTSSDEMSPTQSLMTRCAGEQTQSNRRSTT
jgi:hypothetical protein